ncbi:MAG: hypothetical protein FVQ77_11625 [Cytophagales bacterium]|nr:hypothetical protein [Cytophagales bacterium]
MKTVKKTQKIAKIAIVAVSIIANCQLPTANCFAQILDDTTKLIYGPHTTYYVYEEEIFKGADTLHPVDTLIDGFHKKAVFIWGKKWGGDFYQDLGNLGTASKPMYWQQPDQIGVNLGFDVYTKYAFDPVKIKYYDTKSPFTDIYYLQGGKGEQYLKVGFSRNINKQWNIGSCLRRITSKKQFSITLDPDNPNNKQIDSYALIIFSRFFSENKRYQLLVNYSFLNHFIFENGGIKPDSADTPDSLFNYSLETPNLDSVKSTDRRNNYHLYQRYYLLKNRAIALFHTFDRIKQTNRYKDNNLAGNIDFYPIINFTSSVTSERTIYQQINNKIGFQGRWKMGDGRWTKDDSVKNRDHQFNYNLYFRRKEYEKEYEYVCEPGNTCEGYAGWINENFIGGGGDYFFKDKIYGSFEGEYLFNKDYKLKTIFNSKLLTIGHQRVLISPSLVETAYTSNHFYWKNDSLKPTLSDHSFVELNLGFGSTKISFNNSFYNIKDLIYYDISATAQQSKNDVQILNSGLTLKTHWRKFYTDNQFIYTKSLRADIIRMPEFLINGRLYYQGYMFKSVLYAQIGIEAIWMSSYYADGYMPVTHQFYLQNVFPVAAYPVVDVFINMRIKRVRLFLKSAHINQGFPANGYFVTPYYTGLKRRFDLGLNWLFFD